VERRLKGKKLGNSIQLLTMLQVRVVFTADEKLIEDWLPCVEDAIRSLDPQSGASANLGVNIHSVSSEQDLADGGGSGWLSVDAKEPDKASVKKFGKIGRNKSMKQGENCLLTNHPLPRDKNKKY
jgi:hypothetical protein